MDKKTINTNNVTATIDYYLFLFEPNFNHGQHSGGFYLHGFNREKKINIITSAIVEIHEINGEFYVETRNSIYKIVNSKKVRRHIVEAINHYLKNKDDTSSDFFNNYVPNLLPTPDGWRVF